MSERTKAFFSANAVQLLRWRASIPDLNPVENVWGILIRGVYRHKPAYDSFDLLKDAVNKVWNETSHDKSRR